MSLAPSLIRLLVVAPLFIACGAADVDAPFGDEMDSDQDGIDDATEFELGTDPERSDTDGDGFSDNEEINQGSDPTDGNDRPYLGGWAKDRSCRDGISATGHGVGDIVENFELPDQFGENVSLYDFCGRAVLLVASAEWCGYCREEAPHLTEMYNSYADRGLMIVTLLGETDSGSLPAQENLAGWADQYGQTFPVVADASFGVGARFVEGSSIGLPSVSLLAPGMEVVIADGRPSEQDIEAVLPR